MNVAAWLPDIMLDADPDDNNYYIYPQKFVILLFRQRWKTITRLTKITANIR